uniref:SH2 domain-containing protein 3C-like n=1 Tax=Styela clava TaxID=7725 RepID=UPI00193A3A75|nr:SH2 domain-containing protein 3C-like [Styela clava]
MYEELVLNAILDEDVSPQILLEKLNNELRSGSADIRSYAWFHGKVPRNVAEDLVMKDGDFLVRESITSVGDYVLSSKYKSAYYHFKINKITVQHTTTYSTTQYCLEQHSFESLPALVHYYVEQKLPVSKRTGVILGQPVNRSVPVSYSDVKYASLRRQPKGNATQVVSTTRSPDGIMNAAQQPTPAVRSPVSQIPPHQRKTSDPLPNLPDCGALNYNGQTSPNSNYPMSPGYSNTSSPFPLNIFDNKENVTSPIQRQKDNEAQICVVNPVTNRPTSQVDLSIKNHGQNVPRSGSDPMLSPSNLKSRALPGSHNMNNNNSKFNFQHNNEEIVGTPKRKPVPPKPSRVPSLRNPTVKGPVVAVGPDNFTNRLNSTKNSGKHPALTEVPESVDEKVKTNINLRIKSSPGKNVNDAASKRKRASCFKPMQYQCTMLTNENPPLEQKALIELTKILQTEDPFKLARHMTVIDCKVCRILENDFGRIFLPHASQLRQDIIERYQCIAFWVAICVVKCANGKDERAVLLNTFIQVANELVHSMGNVFGFSAVMHGLTCPQISSLETSWVSLRAKFTNNAVTFDKKLRPLLRLLDEGKGQIRLSTTCIPHIMPLIRLLENPGPGVPHLGSGESMSKKFASFGSLLDRISPTSSIGKEDSLSLHSTEKDGDKTDWWENIPDESFDSLLAHLISGRSILHNVENCKKNANSKLIDFVETEKVREMFTTDFQMRMLFGFKSAESPRRDRFHKFDRIITAMLRHIVD